MPVFDFDDHHPGNDAMPWMRQLKAINPRFRVTLFSVPSLGPPEFWLSHPDWVEICWHGWEHPHPWECQHWDRARMESYLDEPIMACRTTDGWKAPGWQISDASYQVLLERGWWVADQHLEDGRRPPELPVYLYEDGPNWHGHVQDWGSNGIQETWPELVDKVRNTDEFLFASEAAVVLGDRMSSNQ